MVLRDLLGIPDGSKQSIVNTANNGGFDTMVMDAVLLLPSYAILVETY